MTMRFYGNVSNRSVPIAPKKGQMNMMNPPSFWTVGHPLVTIYTTFRSISGWCFGTWIIFPYFPYIGNVIIPTDEVIFFRGVAKNHQPALVTRLVMIIQLEHYMAEGRAHVRAVATQTRNGRNGQNQVSKNGQTWM